MLHLANLAEELLLSPTVMAMFALLAALVKFYSKQSDNGFSRLIVGLWFIQLIIDPSIDAVTQRIVGRWTIAIMLMIEVLSYVLHKYYSSKYAKAIESAIEKNIGEI